MAGYGDTLRQARAHKGVTLKEAEQATRITRHYLAALEEENFDALPPLIYQRGFVRNYAVYLGLDPGKMLALFEESHGEGGGKQAGVTAPPPIDMPNHWAPNFAVIGFAVVLSAIVFAWIYAALVADGPTVDNDTTAEVTDVTPVSNDVELPSDPPTVEPSPEPTEPATPAPTEAVTPTPDDADEADEADDVSDEPNTGGDNAQQSSQSEPAEQEPEPTAEPTGEPATEAQADQAAGEHVTSIIVSGETDIYVTVVADGAVEIEGWIGAGESTEPIVGSTFEVTTSSGANTQFTNACGTTFVMGEEPADATYQLNASADSCEP